MSLCWAQADVARDYPQWPHHHLLSLVKFAPWTWGPADPHVFCLVSCAPNVGPLGTPCTLSILASSSPLACSVPTALLPPWCLLSGIVFVWLGECIPKYNLPGDVGLVLVFCWQRTTNVSSPGVGWEGDDTGKEGQGQTTCRSAFIKNRLGARADCSCRWCKWWLATVPATSFTAVASPRMIFAARTSLDAVSMAIASVTFKLRSRSGWSTVSLATILPLPDGGAPWSGVAICLYKSPGRLNISFLKSGDDDLTWFEASNITYYSLWTLDLSNICSQFVLLGSRGDDADDDDDGIHPTEITIQLAIVNIFEIVIGSRICKFELQFEDYVDEYNYKHFWIYKWRPTYKVQL